jgi:hypothetical protein
VKELTLEPYAARLHWQLPTATDGQGWAAILAEHLESLARRCDETGQNVIGHIKGLAVLPGGGYVRVNVVSPERPADVESTALGQCADLNFDLNVLVYGLPVGQVKWLTHETAASVAMHRGGQVDVEPISQEEFAESHSHYEHELGSDSSN